jgi:hypothetical protein
MTYISNIVRTEGDPKVLRSGPSSLTAPDRLGKMLGWFSLGLGLIELLAPHRITRALGMQGQEALVRAYGAREISSGMLSLSTEKNLGLWSRVGGDGIDISTLLTALRDDNPRRRMSRQRSRWSRVSRCSTSWRRRAPRRAIAARPAIATSIAIAAAFLTVLRLPGARRRTSRCRWTCAPHQPSQPCPIVARNRGHVLTELSTIRLRSRGVHAVRWQPRCD